MDIYIAQISGPPRFYVSGHPEKDQFITESTLFLTRSEAKDFINRSVEVSTSSIKKYLKTKVSKVNQKQITYISMMPNNNTYMNISVEVKGNLWNDFKPQTISLELRGSKITQDILEWSESEKSRIECECQKQWRAIQR
jgi:hypothetical protein